MENKVELKKFIIKIIVFSLTLLLLFFLINILEYKTYTRNFNNKINAIVSALQEKYPNLEEEKIVEILNSDDNNKANILKKYGINIDNKSIIKENNQIHYIYLTINIIYLIISFLILIMLFKKYLNNKEKSINEITKYLEELNKKNYSLKIDSNTEDELSILKNEIYKTTIMLRETRDISLNDKMNLKKSLEDISHQIKTPLTSILVMLDNLIDDPQMAKNVEEDFLRDIKRNVMNINFLIQSILKLAKFDANTIKFNQEKRLLKDIIKEASLNVSPLCDLKNIKLNINGCDDEWIVCDFFWQVEAITNILKNAIEHSPLNSKIDILYEKNNAYAKITIKDYGSGISKEDIAHIFERFYKGQNSSNESIGIGLALAKTIIENDNGIISVLSNNNETIFTIKYFN